jgi:hypothetical protein
VVFPNLKLIGPGSEMVPIDLLLSEDSLTVTARTLIPLNEMTEYTFNITREIITPKGMRIGNAFQWSFITGEADLSTDSDGDSVPDDLDWFPYDPMESEDNDRDSIGDNKDLDDDNDGMTDIWEEKFDLDPKDPADALEDEDEDGLSNLDEFREGSDPRSRSEEEDGIPIYFLVIGIGLLLLIILIGVAVVQRNKMEEGKAMSTYFQEE